MEGNHYPRDREMENGQEAVMKRDPEGGRKVMMNGETYMEEEEMTDLKSLF
jgi:hypothetical protein